MKHRQLFFSIGFFCLLFTIGCEKKVDIVPQDQTPLLVVDGTIENGQPPLVYLTKSFNYFSNLSVKMLAESFVKDAKVTLSNGSRTVLLKQYEIPVTDSTSVFVYSTDISNPAQSMVGVFNSTYTLTIQWQGVTYNAVSSLLPIGRKIDSLWWTPAPANPDTNKIVVFAKITDPPGLGNYIRYYTSVNDSAFLPGINSAFDDFLIDGLTYSLQIPKGVNRNVKFDNDEFGFFKRGDTVRIKMSNIDKSVFDFWRTWEQNQSNIGNPFGVPVKVLGNVSNGALGLFAAYAARISSIIIPK